MKEGSEWRIAAIVAAATVGDGVFALPYVFYNAGWLVALFYLVLLSVLVITAHVIYLRTLASGGEKERLLGLASRYLGGFGFWVGFVAVVLGLLLTLVAYLILGSQFIHLAVPFVSTFYASILFWLLISLPVLLPDHYVVDLELTGIICTSIIIALIFFTALPNIFTGFFGNLPAINIRNLFLPFGAVLFSLAGWTSIEPAYESWRHSRGAGVSTSWKALAAGTLFAALLYAMFAAGILGSASMITPDTASGLATWPFWKREMLAIMGLVAVGTVYIPISREIKNALEKDLRWNKIISRAVIVLFPPSLIALGLNDFMVVVGLVGGFFLSTQYLLIISVGRRALTLSPAKKFFLDLIAAVFIAAAVYQLYLFIVR